MFIPLVRCIVFNLHLICIYSVYDLYQYIKNKGWEKFNMYGIRMYIGMFGHGKTLSMTHTAMGLYQKYGDTLRFISNYELKDIPYIPLINFNQLVDLGEIDEDPYQGTVVLIDEIENVLSHRNFASFPLPLLHTLTQQRKKKVFILCSAQRFFMVDKIFRSITTHVVDCNKYWRLQHIEYYDAWDLEQATNTNMVKRLGHKWYFVHNRDYYAYDTSSMVKKGTAEDFISNDEILMRRGEALLANMDGVKNMSRAAKSKSKNKK